MKPETAKKRFLSKVDRTDLCWFWEGYVWPNGYGQYRAGGHNYAHRWAFTHYIGPIPDGLVIDHLCRNKACVNPDHLEAVPQRENLHRGPTTLPAIAAARTHCIHGHEFTNANTHRARGRRWCKECSRRRTREAALRERVELNAH